MNDRQIDIFELPVIEIDVVIEPGFPVLVKRYSLTVGETGDLGTANRRDVDVGIIFLKDVDSHR